MGRAVEGVIFDMDGTITVPALDFALMKAEMGLPGDKAILEALEDLDAAAREAAEEILLRHELDAAHGSLLNDGVPEALDALRHMGLPAAILTRNRRAAVDIVLARHSLRFAAIVTREDSRPKPDPDGVHVAARALAAAPEKCVMLGDYEFDIQAGRAAGAITVLYSPAGRRYATEADYCLRSMRDLPPLMESLLA